MYLSRYRMRERRIWTQHRYFLIEKSSVESPLLSITDRVYRHLWYVNHDPKLFESPERKWSLFFHPLILSWPYEPLWPIKHGRGNAMGLLSLSLKRLLSLSLFRNTAPWWLSLCSLPSGWNSMWKKGGPEPPEKVPEIWLSPFGTSHALLTCQLTANAWASSSGTAVSREPPIRPLLGLPTHRIIS